MSIEVHALQRVRVAIESTYGTDMWTSGSGSANFLDVPLQEGSAQIALDRFMGNPNEVVTTQDAQSLKVPGLRSWSLTFTMPLHGLGTAASGGTASLTKNDAALLRLLYACMGGIDEGNTGTTISAQNSASAFTLTSGASFGRGNGGVWVNSSSIAEMRVHSAAGTVFAAYSSAPQNGNTYYATTTCYLDDVDTSMQFVVEGKEAQDCWLLKGGACTGGFSINCPHDDIWTISFTITGAGWENLSSATLGAATYNNYKPQAYATSCYFQANSSATLVKPVVSSVSFAPQVRWQLVRSPNGRSENVYRAKRVRSAPACTVSLRFPFEDVTYQTARDNQTLYQFGHQLGGTVGSCVLLHAVRLQIVNVQRVDDEGMAYQEVTCESAPLQSETAISQSAFGVIFG